MTDGPTDAVNQPTADRPQRNSEHEIANLRRAFASFGAGDSGPVMAMLDRDVHWLGIPHGHLWWRCTLTRNGPDQVQAVFPWRDSSPSPEPRRAQVGGFIDAGDRIIITYERPTNQLPHATTADCFYQVVTMRDGKVAHIHDHLRRTDALKAGSGRGW